jgi:hypothetical protein
VNTEQVEWLVGRYDNEGRLVTTRDGAQSVFSKSRAQTLAKKRGPEWSLFHYKTNLSPEAQAQFEADARKAEEAARQTGQTYGSQWAP